MTTSMDKSPKQMEAAEQALVTNVISNVRRELSGRDSADLVDILPSRNIFAGVLQPPRSRTTRAARTGAVLRDIPDGTAIGLDFRVRPEGTRPKLTITAEWAHYYPVFPSFDQVLETLDLPSASESPPDVSPSTERSTQLEDESVETSTTSEHEDGPPEDQVQAASTKGELVLPRVWRRVDVAPASVETAIAVGERLILATSEIRTSLVDAARKIETDAQRWHHLDQPEKRERTITTSGDLSPAAFESLLAAKRGRPVDPPTWELEVDVECSADPSDPSLQRIRVYLVNKTAEAEDPKADIQLQDRNAYDARLQVRLSDATVVPFDFVLAPRDYRTNPLMPVKGINCAAVIDPESPTLISSESLPVFEQALYRTREEFEVTFADLAQDTFMVPLDRLGERMGEFLAEWRTYLSGDATHELNDAGQVECSRDCAAFERERRNYTLGIAALRADAKLRAAFQLMNQAFLRLGERSGGRMKSWRLFQIAFICAQLPSIAARDLDPDAADEHATALKDHLQDVGILWFPTGGGKTEAYLGLIATALLYDRLRGKERGVTAWMRFPLRMLSMQQLDRLARVIAILNELRAETAAIARGDPFAIGYYVGDNNTPNELSSDELDRYARDASARADVKLIRRCPHCSADVAVDVHRPSWRLRHVCSNPDCFSNSSASLGRIRGSLPIFIVDHEIYRYLPSVLLGTVDKLAIIGRARYFHHLVRGATQECPEHGYASYDQCVEHWNAGCKRTKSQLNKLPPYQDSGPALILQDELHLLRDELGVFNGHYEGLFRLLNAERHLPPKILCATATIEAYHIQAFHLYMASAARFPQPGWKAGESFYATTTPLQIRRRYVGVYCHTRAIEDAALRITGLYQKHLRRALSDANSRATLFGSAEADLDVTRLLHLHDLTLCYVHRKAVAGSIVDKLSRLNQFLVRQGVEPLRGAILTGDQTVDDIGVTIDLIERQIQDVSDGRLDVVAATNLISHGVDLERINMMTICGMPSHYAEYVQASSRSARSHPGAIFVCFNGRDPRERSQFEFFFQMHEHMDRLIEAVAVNRFASYAPRKTVPGLLIGLLMNKYSPSLYGSRISKPLENVPTLQGALGLRPAPGGPCLSADDLRQDLERVIGVDEVRPPASPAQVENTKRQIHLAFDDAWNAISRAHETNVKNVLDPITSFRDVDEGIDFASIASSSLVIRTRSR